MTTEPAQATWTKPPEVPQATAALDTTPKTETKLEDKTPPPAPKTYTEAEYKGLQRSLNKLQSELTQARELGASLSVINELKADIQELKGGLELVIGNYGKTNEEITEPLPGQYERMKQASRAQLQQQVAAAVQIREAQADIREMIEEAGLEVTAAELAPVWAAVSPQEAVRLTRKITSKIIRDKQEASFTERQNKAIENAALEIRRKLGLDSADTSMPAGKKGGRKPSIEELRKTPAAEVKKKFASGEWTDK